MSNMSYCRFENTASDLRDCKNAIDNQEINDMSSYEQTAFVDLILLCKEISEQFEDYDEDELKTYIKNLNKEE